MGREGGEGVRQGGGPILLKGAGAEAVTGEGRDGNVVSKKNRCIRDTFLNLQLQGFQPRIHRFLIHSAKDN